MTSKRINVVSIQLVREKSFLFPIRKVSSPEILFELVKPFLLNEDREHLLLVCVDTKNQPTSISTISVGSLNSSVVHPREVFKAAILSNAHSIFLAHNHPSGDTCPSREDIGVTQRIDECGKILGIPLLDHIIVGDDSYLSFKDKSLI